MTLFELAFACYIYRCFTADDASYLCFLTATNHSPDLSIQEHRQALLTWLNQWGCRQFANRYREKASDEILSWFNEFNVSLPGNNRNLWDITEQEFVPIGSAYESLSGRIASYRNENRSSVHIRFGSIGAAKILFAIRPRSFVPWDNPIRDSLRFNNNYVGYLQHVRSLIEELAQSCRLNGFELSDLPGRLGMPLSTVPKLIDQYYWVTITKGCCLPDEATFQQWANWNR